MAFHALLRYALITPLQIAIFLMIPLPLALFAGITTFFSVMLLSSRLLLVYVDLIVSVVFASTRSHRHHHHPYKRSAKIAADQPARPLSIQQRSPPRSPPRGYGGREGYHASQSFTAPSSPNISRKRMAAAGQFPSQNGLGTLSPPLSMKGNIVGSLAVGAKSSPSTPSAQVPPFYGYESGNGNGNGNFGRLVPPRHGRRNSVKNVDVGEEYSGDYFTPGVVSRG